MNQLATSEVNELTYSKRLKAALLLSPPKTYDNINILFECFVASTSSVKYLAVKQRILLLWHYIQLVDIAKLSVTIASECVGLFLYELHHESKILFADPSVLCHRADYCPTGCLPWFILYITPFWLLYDLQQYNWSLCIWSLPIHWTLQYYYPC